MIGVCFGISIGLCFSVAFGALNSSEKNKKDDKDEK
jgi:hypothetical protein